MKRFSHMDRQRFYKIFDKRFISAISAIERTTNNNTLSLSLKHWQSFCHMNRQRYYKNFSIAIDCCTDNYNNTLKVSLKQWKRVTWLITTRPPLLTCTDKDIDLVDKIFKQIAETTKMTKTIKPSLLKIRPC